MRKFAFSGLAASLLGAAMLMPGPAPASAVTLAGPSLVAPGQTAQVELVQERRYRQARRGDRQARRGEDHVRRYDRRRHGPRYTYRRPGFGNYYGGYYYSSPWWVGPSIGFAVTVPSVTLGLGGGSAHVEWCLNRYRSYDPASDTFLGYDGYRHRCNSPYR